MSEPEPQDEKTPAPLNPREYVLFDRGNQHLFIDPKPSRQPSHLPLAVVAVGLLLLLAYVRREALGRIWTSAIPRVQGLDLVTVLSLAAVATILALWLIPTWQASRIPDLTPKERFDKENEARKTLAQLVAGLVFFGSFYSAINTFKTSQTQLEVTRDAQITDRFIKAIEQLGATDKDGNPLMERRLGAIYALERIAQESERDHWPIMEVLTAYVRQHVPNGFQKARETKLGTVFGDAPLPRRIDVQAALTVIGRRSDARVVFERERGAMLDLSGTDLRHARLARARLQNAYFFGAQLQGANLFEAQLQGAWFDRAQFQGGSLFRAQLQGTQLGGAQGLTQSGIDEAVCDQETELPPGLICKNPQPPSPRYK